MHEAFFSLVNTFLSLSTGRYRLLAFAPSSNYAASNYYIHSFTNRAISVEVVGTSVTYWGSLLNGAIQRCYFEMKFLETSSASLRKYHCIMWLVDKRSAVDHFMVLRLFIRSREVSKPRDWYFKLFNRIEIWQAHRQHCCRSACQISERSDNSKYKSRGFETLRDLTERRLFGYWDGTLELLADITMINFNMFQCVFYNELLVTKGL